MAEAGERDALRVIHQRDQALIERLQGDLLQQADDTGRAVRQLVETCRRLEQAVARIALLENSLSFRFGNLLVTSIKSRQFSRLPRLLWRLWRERRADVEPVAEPLRTAASHSSAVTSEAPSAWDPSGMVPGRRDEPRRAPESPAQLSQLRVAAVMDDFTKACFMPTCQVTALHAERYEQQLLEVQPHLVLVESAWRGEEGSWRHMVAERSGELLGLLDMCRRRGIPTVFWNKEDPAHFSTFLDTARLFDHVFTTDIDSIRRYAAALGHARVHLLPFASQPRIHNPLMRGSREQGFSFAGSYYHRYPERCEDFDRLILTLAELGPVVIYDRNSERADPAFAFPRRFAPMLQPALPYERIDEAYKGHRFAVNMNTVKQSQSMFARRVFELMACNTIVVSNYSRGMRSLFGDLVVATDQVEVLRERLQPMITAPQGTRRHRLLALRKVLSQHTYEHRMQQVARTVLGSAPALENPAVITVARIASEDELASVLEAYRRQLYLRRKLLLVSARDGIVMDAVPARGAYDVLREKDAAAFDLSQVAPEACLAVLHPADHYGPHYLSDLAMATRFSDASVIGKGAHYRRDGDGATLQEGPRYREGQPLLRRSSIARGAALAGVSLGAWLDFASLGIGEPPLHGVAVDEFNYCRDGAGLADVSAEVDVDDSGLDHGLELDELLDRADSLSGLPSRARHREKSVEVNARPADFAACVGRADRLLVVDDVLRLHGWQDVAHVDVFACTESGTRSFVEHAGLQVMQGDARDLCDLLANNAYGELVVPAPGAVLCEVLEQQVRSHPVRIHLRPDDVRDADAGTPWVGLLAQRFPRLSLVVDPAVDLGRLWALVGAPFEARQWRVA